jgi:hypothetical protein
LTNFYSSGFNESLLFLRTQKMIAATQCRSVP